MYSQETIFTIEIMYVSITPKCFPVVLSLSIIIRFIRVLCVPSYSFICWVEFYHMHVPQFVYIYAPVDAHLVVSRFWLLQAQLSWTFTCKSFCRHIFSFLWGKQLGLKCLGHMVSICPTFLKTTKQFLKVVISALYTICSWLVSLIKFGTLRLLNFRHVIGYLGVSWF